MYKWFLAYQYLIKRRIAYFAVAAVGLCAAMVLVVHSVMNGFVDTLKNSSRKLLGDVILEVGSTESFPFYDEFIELVKKELPGQIQAASPVVMNYGLIKILDPFDRDRVNTVLVNGIRLEEYKKVNGFSEGLYYDHYYPGTTTLAPTSQPTWYYDLNDLRRLPEQYESALARYREVHPQDSTLEKESGLLGPGNWPGLFEPANNQQIERFLDSGDRRALEYRDQPLPGVILGVEMVHYFDSKQKAYLRMYPLGTKVRLMLLSMTTAGDVTADKVDTHVLRYVDDSRTKVYEIDKQALYCDFDWLQEKLRLDRLERLDGTFSPPRAMQIQIKLIPDADYHAARDIIEKLFMERFLPQIAPQLEHRDLVNMQYMQIRTWEERNQSFILAVEKERILVLILFAIVSLVAVFLIGCIFYMIVQQKRRDIGIIKSMGASSRGVAGIFLSYALAVGTVGAVFGLSVGALFVRYINEFQDFIATQIHPGLRVWSPETYSFDKIPSVVRWEDVLIIGAVAVLASVIGSLLPAMKAAKVWPVDAIRYE
ncbi:MAG: hypothetical protein HJJLKODD_01768 [Phycisphaerae bacterium]|nr:hypothetical protein [Phycisphaerae bacterium]